MPDEQPSEDALTWPWGDPMYGYCDRPDCEEPVAYFTNLGDRLGRHCETHAPEVAHA